MNNQFKNTIDFIKQNLLPLALITLLFGFGVGYLVSLNQKQTTNIFNQDQSKDFLTYKDRLTNEIVTFNKDYTALVNQRNKEKSKFTEADKSKFLEFFKNQNQEFNKIDCQKVETDLFQDCQDLKKLLGGAENHINRDTENTGWVIKDIRYEIGIDKMY